MMTISPLFAINSPSAALAPLARCWLRSWGRPAVAAAVFQKQFLAPGVIANQIEAMFKVNLS
jgi:hypothetical protein